MNKFTLIALMLVVSAMPVLAAGYTFLNVGIDYLNQDRYPDAVQWFDKAIAAGDLNSDQTHVAYVDRGRAHFLNQEPDKAIPDFTAALAIQPFDPLVLAERAFSHVGANQPEQALDDLVALQKIRPTDSAVDYERGLVEWQLGRYAEAAASFSKASEHNNNVYAWLWLQLANLKTGGAANTFEIHYSDTVHLKYAANHINGWPDPLIAFYNGGTESEVFDAVNQDKDNQGAACEANFYVGEWHLVHGDATGAKALIEKAAADCPKSYFELRMAEFEMKKL